MELINTTPRKFLVVIVGPTAVGKSDVGVDLAKKFGIEIISADSRQFYRELTIGTAKPASSQLDEVKHHFINSLSIHDTYSAGKFEEDALAVLDRLYQESSMVLLVGGSGMYVDALCMGFSEMPQVPKEIREIYNNLLESKGLEYLAGQLLKKDPETYERIDVQNPQRVVRALEVIHATGERFSTFKALQPAPRPFELIKLGLELEREVLYTRINSRMDRMIGEGLFAEAEQFYPHRDLYALQTVGYSEIFGFMDGKYDREEAIRLLKRNSRRYAKRQMTWFKRDPEVVWFHPDDLDRMADHISERMQ